MMSGDECGVIIRYSQLPEEQVQELEEPEQPQSPFILMVLVVWVGGGL